MGRNFFLLSPFLYPQVFTFTPGAWRAWDGAGQKGVTGWMVMVVVVKSGVGN